MTLGESLAKKLTAKTEEEKKQADAEFEKAKKDMVKKAKNQGIDLTFDSLA